jgi:hypothetical protein
VAAKLQKSREKCKIRVNNCKKNMKDLFEQEKMFIFATTLPTTEEWKRLLQKNGSLA